MLLAATAPLNIENAAPIDYGFSTGYYLAFHGFDNLALKQKMYRAYILFCPALSYGHFASGADATERYAVSGFSETDHPTTHASPPLVRGGDVYTPASRRTSDIRPSGVGAVQNIEMSRSEEEISIEDSTCTTCFYWGEEHLGEWEVFLVDSMQAAPLSNMRLQSVSRSVTNAPPFPVQLPSRQTQGGDTWSFSLLPGLGAALPRGSREATGHRRDESDGRGRQAPVVRVGFVSRFFYSHPVGFLFEEVIRILSTSTLGPTGDIRNPCDSDSSDIERGCLVVETDVFMLEARSSTDPVSRSIEKYAHTVHKVAPDLNQLVDTIRSAKLDILIYTDLGLDPITYFASFSRLAPIQVTGESSFFIVCVL